MKYLHRVIVGRLIRYNSSCRYVFISQLISFPQTIKNYKLIPRIEFYSLIDDNCLFCGSPWICLQFDKHGVKPKHNCRHLKKIICL